MAKWATRFDTKPIRCPGCGKRIRRGDWVYKEGFALFCRDCGRQKDRAAFDKARTRDRKQMQRQLLALPEKVAEGGSPTEEIRFSDGGSYKGQVERGLMHGKGTYTFPNGDSYSGDFREGLFCGSGAYTFADGEQHAGIFADDHLSGEGYCIFPDGGRIKGIFQDDMFIKGRGWRGYGEERYRGDFGKGAVMEGLGAYVTEGGDCCLGEFKRDAFWGFGRLMRRGGTVIDGVFEDGELKTRCDIDQKILEDAAEAAGLKIREDRIEYQDGTVYMGGTAFGFPHGEGSITSPSGYSYSGSWVFGRFQKGFGSILSRRGNLYEGEIGVGGRPEGRGVLRRQDGTAIEGMFREGRPVDGEVLAYDADGLSQRQLYIGGRAIARRGWWEILDSEDEDRDGTNIWLMAEGESRISPMGGSDFSLGTVMLSDSVTEIAPNAFNEMYIRRVIIPEGVKKIGEKAFFGWGPSQIIAVEGDMTRFSDGWLSGSYARVISLHELLGESTVDVSALMRRRMRFPGGAWYEGETLEGVMHGNGVYRFENGDRYEGEFRNGYCCGWGVCKFKDTGSYVGEFREDQPFGAGTMFYQGGDRYEGEWLMGRRFGYGRYTYADGEVVEGMWRDGQLLRPCSCPKVLERLCPDSLS